MKLPKLRELESSRQMVDVFRGYNHNMRISDGEFFEMKNMTSDYYPVLSPRKKRGVYATSLANPTGMIAKDELCYVDSTRFVIGDTPVNMGLNEAHKQLVSMGAYVIILPDKKWINTETKEFGDIEASFISTSDVKFELCTITGEEYTGAEASDNAPENPSNQDLWIDTSTEPHTLKKYSTTSGMWISIATTYIKISSIGIGEKFSQYDGVTISGINAEGLTDLNGSTALWGCGKDYIIVVGLLDKVTTQTTASGAVTIERKMPKMDYIIESGNRLWGCRYGTANNGDTVNEIYASKLGDFKNWSCFMNLATDSYVASCGTDGQFTGAIAHMGYPLFFKENCVHKVYGNYPANYQIQTTTCRGVQKGCNKSLAIVNETLYYKSRGAVCAYDGSLPVEVSYALGNEAYSKAVAGRLGNKYYISMYDTTGTGHLFVYDTVKGMWHKEDNFWASDFCTYMNELYCIKFGYGEILSMTGSGTPEPDSVEWMVQTGEIGISSPDMKYISRLTVRMSMDIDSEVSIYAQYDFSEEWETLFSLRSNNMRSFSLPIRPKRCDHMKLRIEGVGDAKIYSITKTIEQGSDIS
jgi:hypothetical protein